MLILGIETSCDETGIAAFDSSKGLLSHALHSQVAMHRDFGGVVPELASRDHIRRLIPLIEEVLQEADRTLAQVDCLAFTQGPGLGGALLAGAGVVSGLALALNKPVVGVHHLEGHLLSPMLSGERPALPYVALLVSGGHTQLMLVTAVGQYTLLGETLDDAAGEAFDKVATLLGLGYPGGPALAKLAERGNPARFAFPRPMLHSGDLNFSFSGLKTAVATLIQRERGDSASLADDMRADVAASFQAAVVEVLSTKCLAALRTSGAHDLVVAGGVGANCDLRARLQQETARHNQQVLFPPMELCTDNGAMIAFAAALRLDAGIANIRNAAEGFEIRPRWPLHQIAG